MKNKKKKGFNSLVIHGKKETAHPAHALNTPLFQTTSFTFEDMEHVERVMSFESDDYVYTRGNNPTLRAFEERMACLENGTGAVAFSSGMGAISTVLLSLLQPGDRVLAHRTLYGSSFHFLESILPRYGIRVDFADLTQEDWEERAAKDVKILFTETPANPNLDVIDLERVAAFCRERRARSVVDNTFATPYFQRPLDFGVDVVVHSATKYLCGHGDALGGVAVASSEEYINSLKFEFMCELGNVMSPFNAWLLLRGIKTLGLRMEVHEKNAKAVADFLSDHGKVRRVYYPGLNDTDFTHRQMRGCGGVVSFEPTGGIRAAEEFVGRLRLAKLAVSLGDAETLVQIPSRMTHRDYPTDRLKEFGFSEDLVRISVGLEDAEDILEDMSQALK